MKNKLKKLIKRHSELQKELMSEKIITNFKKRNEKTREYHELDKLINKYLHLKGTEKAISEAEKIIKEEKDKELVSLAEEELKNLNNKKKELEKEVKEIVEPKNPLDKKDIIVEIRAGTGGEEAALFATDLFRMYSKFAEKRGWNTHLISSNRTGIGGLKEAIFEITGQNVYSHLKYESGVHRVQRVPKTEKSGRLHTSAATVAILPTAEEIDVELKPEELKIETSTSRGHGGQSVNTTYSAIRVTHLPTGLVVSCQDERSQQQNKAKALQVLRSRLLAQEEEKRRKEEAKKRKSQVGSGDRSEKIRTYNFPQNRVTDHRINKNWHNLEEILNGDLNQVVTSLKEADEHPKDSSKGD